MQISYVYILKCNDESYYVGITNNIIRRFEEHQNGIDSKSYKNIEVAIEIEKKIKKWSKVKKEALIENRIIHLPNLSKKKF